ncbi:MAG: beta-N-acetylhexosaminidase [Actinomycetota bacterium]|nr:beta-N-acetylhexosaminidase [Actinomycetota bacterium]
MHDRTRARVLVALTVAGIALTGLVVWITTPPSSSAGPDTQLDSSGVAALGPSSGLSPVTPGPTLARSAPTITATGAGNGADAATGTAAGSRVGDAPTPGPTTTFPGRSAAVAAPAQVPNCTPVSLAQRAARTLIVGIPDVTDPSDPIVKTVLDIGVGGIFLNPGNVVSESQLMRLVRGIRAQAGRPIVITVDEEPGRVSSLGDILGPSPSARRMANEGPASDVRTYAHEVALELARLGIDLNLAPVADLTDGPYDEIIGDRSFSADAAIASEYALAFAEGMADAGIRSAVKHFPGQGRATEDIHFEAAAPITTPLDTLRLTDVRPFRDLVRAGVPVVMMNHIRYTALDRNLPASLSPKAYSLLRDLGFQGVAITDSLGMGAVNLTWGFFDSAPMAVAAGADGLLATDGFFAEEMRDGLVDAVAKGRLTEARLSEAAARMVALGGGNPRTVACVDVTLPHIAPTPLP